MVTLQQFINDWSGKKVPSRGGIIGQCVSLSQHWAEDNGVTGTPVFPVASAYQMPNTRKDFFTYEANTPKGVPAPGDIVVFSNRVGGGHGHTGVVVSANTQTLDVFQQNDPRGSGAYTKRYNYANVLGWLKLKKAVAPPQGVVMNNQSGVELYRTGLHRDPENSQVADQWNGMSPAQALNVLRTTAEWQATDAKIKAYDSLRAQVAELSTRPTKAELEGVRDALNASNAKIKQLEDEVKSNPDTILIDEGKNWLQKIIARFTK